MKLSISQEDFRNKCLYCKQKLSTKYISHPVDDDLSQIIFQDSHKACFKKAFEISLIENEIKEQEKNLKKLRRRLGTLKGKEEFIHTCEIGATLN